MPRQSIAEQLERARRIFDVIKTDSELRTLLTGIGYTETTIAQGQGLYESVLAARTSTHAAHGDQLGATNALDEQREQVERQVSALTQTARAIFADNRDAQETLGLRLGARATPSIALPDEKPAEGAPPESRQPSRSFGALLDRARVLYDGALGDPALLAELTTVGYPQTRLQNERAMVDQLAAIDAKQESNKATAQARTGDQRLLLERLNDWIARFRGVVRPALRDRPDLLTKLGL